MPTLKQLTDNLKSIIRAGSYISDDDNIKDRQLEFIIGYIRATLIRQDYEKGRTINQSIVQDLGILDLELANPAECSDIDITSIPGCSGILRTEVLPKFIEVYQKNLITYVGSIDKRTSFQLIEPERVRWQKYSKYTSNVNYAYYLNNRIYLPNNVELRKINIRGVMEDPRDAGSYSTCGVDGQSSCYQPTDEYPIATWMIKTMNDLILQGELKLETIMRSDTTNDASGNINYGKN